MAVFGEPPLASVEVGYDPLDAPPEIGAMVGLHEVYEFVDNYVLDDARREADGPPVEVEGTFASAGAPAVAEPRPRETISARRSSKTSEQRFKKSIPKMYSLNSEASILPRRMSAAANRCLSS